MKITDIRMEKVDSSYSKALANFDVTFDNCFVVHNISLIKRNDSEETFIAFYSRKNLEGKFINICHPITREFRNEIEAELKNFYEEHKDDTDVKE